MLRSSNAHGQTPPSQIPFLQVNPGRQQRSPDPPQGPPHRPSDSQALPLLQGAPLVQQSWFSRPHGWHTGVPVGLHASEGLLHVKPDPELQQTWFEPPHGWQVI
jgi:hypothetical protein